METEWTKRHAQQGDSAMSEPYGARHQAIRAKLLPAAYGTLCPRCSEPMLKGQDLDLGHSEDLMFDPLAIGDRIEHATCNRSAGAALGNKHRARKPSRRWR